MKQLQPRIIKDHSHNTIVQAVETMNPQKKSR